LDVSYRSRALFVIVVFGVASAAFATLRWKTWTPTTACLLCDMRTAGDGAAASSASPEFAGGGGAIGSSAASSTGSAGPGSLVAAPAAVGERVVDSAARSAPRGWQPWSAGSGRSAWPRPIVRTVGRSAACGD
jgi:hypothetical protein